MSRSETRGSSHPEEEKLARRVFGDRNFERNGKFFYENGFNTVADFSIFVLVPEHVRQRTSDGPIALVSLFNNNTNLPYFKIGYREIYYHRDVRGKSRVEKEN